MRSTFLVEREHQTVAAAIVVPGTPYVLHYRSDRCLGRTAAYELNVGLLGPEPDPRLAAVDVEAAIAGQRFTRTFDPVPELRYIDRWDGADRADGPAQHHTAALRIGYHYRARRWRRRRSSVWADRKVVLGVWDSRRVGLGGWTLGGYEALEQIDARVVMQQGDGRHHDVALLTASELEAHPAPAALARSAAPDERFVLLPGEQRALVFDADLRHVRSADYRSGVTIRRFDHDAAGRLARVTNRDGEVTSIERDGDGRPRSIRVGERVALELACDEHGWLSALGVPGGVRVELSCTPLGLLDDVREPQTVHTRFEYDEGGRVVRMRGPEGESTDFARLRVPNGYRVVRVSPEGRESSHEISRAPGGPFVRVTHCCGGSTPSVTRLGEGTRTATLPDGTRTSYFAMPASRTNGRSVEGAVVTRTLETPGGVRTVEERSRGRAASGAYVDSLVLDGNRFETVVDVEARTVVSRSPLGREIAWKSDDEGRPVEISRFGRSPDEIRYGASGGIERIVHGPLTLSVERDQLRRVTRVTDNEGRATAFEDDAAGRLQRQVVSGGSALTIEYDDADRIVAITPPGRPPTRFEYSHHGTTADVFPAVDGSAPRTLFGYDRDGNLTSIERADGRRVEAAYGAAGELLRIATPEGDVELAYDERSGAPREVRSGGGEVVRYEWDGVLPTAVETQGTVGGRIDLDYATMRRIRSSTVAGSAPLLLEHDADGLLIAAGPLRIERDARSGAVVAMQLGIVREEREYDDDDRLVRQTVRANADPLLSRSYSYDVLGRITAVGEESGDREQMSAFEYDLDGRLIAAAEGALTQRFTYGANGNLVLLERDGDRLEGEYDARDQVARFGPYQCSYNLDGELIRRETGGEGMALGYDSAGHLARVTLPGGSEVEYVLDGHGRRIGWSVDGRLERGLLYEDQYGVAAEYDGAGALLSRFVRLEPSRTPRAILRGEDAYLVVIDHVGSPSIVVDAQSGEVVQRLRFDVLGRTLEDSSPGFQPFGFGGGLVDGVSGLVHLGERDYDPELGRWLSRDPLLFRGGSTNLYSYAANDPVNRRDPFGRDVEVCRSPAFGTFGEVTGASHEWARTSTVEAGMGQHPASPWPGATAVVDHSGRGDRANCETIPNIDEECVNAQLEMNKTANGMRYGRELGIYGFTDNNCQQFLEEVFYKCRTDSDLMTEILHGVNASPLGPALPHEWWDVSDSSGPMSKGQPAGSTESEADYTPDPGQSEDAGYTSESEESGESDYTPDPGESSADGSLWE